MGACRNRPRNQVMENSDYAFCLMIPVRDTRFVRIIYAIRLITEALAILGRL